MHVLTDLEDVKRTRVGSIIGRVWFSSGDVAFPAHGWTDFVVVLLGWWIREILELRRIGRRHGELLFMDGPFSVGVEATDHSCALSFLKDERPVAWMPVPILTRREDLEEDLLAAATAAIAVCRREEWTGDDVSALTSLANELAKGRPPRGEPRM